MDERAAPGKLIQRLDSIEINKTYFTSEGYLMDTPIVTTTGIFEYTNADGSKRRELRLPEYVFEPESLQSYKGKPIIVTHQAGVVNKENVGDEIIGTILSEGIAENDHVKAQICIHDTDAMRDSGLKELSLGYSLELDETPGEWNGQPYDAIQKNIRINHLALVGTARAGSTAKLNIDSKDEILKGGKVEMNKPNNKVMSAQEIKAAIENYNAQARTDGTVEITIPGELLDNGQVSVEEKAEEPQEENAEDSTPTIDEIKAAVAEGNVGSDKLVEYVNTLLGMVGSNADEVKKQEEAAETPNEPVEPVATPAETNEPIKEDENCKVNTDGKEVKEMPNAVINMDSKEIAEKVDQMVSEKLGVCRVGEKLGLDLESKTLIQAKKEIIAKAEPTVRLDGATDDEINGMYLMAKAKVESAKSTDLQRQEMFNADGNQPQEEVYSAASAREKMINNMGGVQ